MKKLFTLLFASLMAMGATAAEPEYSFNWATSIEGTVAQAANVIGVKQAADGNYFAAMVWGGTTAAGKTVSWGGRNLQDAAGADIEGADYTTGTSYVSNLLFAKIDKATGNPLWTVYSNFGYAADGNSALVPTEDGGAIALVTFRQSQGADPRLAAIVGADGTVTHLQHTDADKWAYRSVLVKIDADGKVMWTRTMNALDETPDGADATTPFYTYDVAVAADGRIYVAGRMCTTVYFQGRAGRIVAKDAACNEGWTGNSQTACGNAFVAAFDKDGYVTDVITPAADGCQYTQAARMVIDGTTLYVAGTMKKAAEGALVQPTLTTIDMTDNTVKAYREYGVEANTGGKQNFNVYSLTLIGGSLYMTGHLAGSLTDGNVTLAATGTAAQLDGYIARMDTDGNLLAARNYGTLNTGIMGVAEVNGGLVALAYQMTGAGAVALAYDKALTSELSRVTLMTAGTTATAAAPLFDGENLVVLSRGAKAASAFYGTTDVKPALTRSFGVLFGSWKVSGGIGTGISAVKAQEDGDHYIYNVNGMRMTSAESVEKGIYISNGRKVVVK